MSARLDLRKHNPDPEYLRKLIERAGLNQVTAAREIGIAPRTMRRYVSLDKESYRPAPYTIQFMLECLAKAGK